MLKINLKPGHTRLDARPVKKTGIPKRIKVFVGFWGGLALVIAAITTAPTLFYYVVLGCSIAIMVWGSWRIISDVVSD
jgi:hypothetical protein